MDFEETLAASHRFKGPLGAVAYVVTHGLELGGVDALTTSAVLDALRKGLKGLSEDQCDVLVQVLEHRLAEARRQGALYELVRLTGRMSSVEAHMAHDALAQQGIRAQYNNDHRSDPFPDAAPDTELWVRRSDLERAQAILAAPGETAEHEILIKCPSCGEENPAHFGKCWSCEASLADVVPEALTQPVGGAEPPAEE